jgi:hypothetical protein
MVLKCAKGEESIECLECKLIFCSEFCNNNHVCHPTSIDFDDCRKDPSVMVQWMFERLDACVLSIKSLHRFLDRREDQMLTLLTHLIRSKHEDSTFDRITAQLLDDEVFLILDYKMKLLPMFYRESQASFFGKRGITWLGFLLIRKKTAAEVEASRGSLTDYVLVFYDVISDDGKEDGESVINCVASVLKNYKSGEGNEHINKCIVGSDGAAYFSGSDLFIAFASMGLWTGIKIIMHVVSEAGQGKSRVDNHFAVSNMLCMACFTCS